ncbi:MAG TPA: type II secretion system protein GspK [Smithellaceae bacterium]|nr:type II secretion system protein GspK [Smithellaceae bacterium]
MINVKNLTLNIIGKEKGIALIIVLWIMTLLIVITFAFSVTVRTEVFSTITFKEQLENKYLAEAGMNRAILEIFYRSAYKNNQINLEGAEVYSTDGSFHHGQTGGGHYQFACMDETGKININLLTDATAVMLNNLLINLGVEESQADVIVDSILDWKDGDDLHRLHGAEDDYYGSLPQPYKAKNANFDTLEELLLVQGVTRDILYGAGGKPGLIKYLTLYSSSVQVNINTASVDVLKAIPSMTDDMIQTIISYREADNTKKDGSGLQSVFTAPDYAKVAPFVTTMDSNVYSIEAIGYKSPAGSQYAIRMVVRIEGADRYKILYYQNPAYIEMPKNEQL